MTHASSVYDLSERSAPAARAPLGVLARQRAVGELRACPTPRPQDSLPSKTVESHAELGTSCPRRRRQSGKCALGVRTETVRRLGGHGLILGFADHWNARPTVGICFGKRHSWEPGPGTPSMPTYWATLVSAPGPKASTRHTRRIYSAQLTTRMSAQPPRFSGKQVQ